MPYINKRNKKIFLIGCTILLSILLSHKADAADNRKVLTVWAMGAEGEKIGKIARKFEAINPDIKVVTQAIPWGAAHEKLVTGVAGESVPDICQMGTTWVPEFQAIDALLPLDEYIEKSSLIKPEKFFSGSWNTNSINGKMYGIPWYVDTRVLFYRIDLLKQIGYDNPPKDWNELKDICKKLTKDIDHDGKIDRYGISLGAKDWGLLAMFIWQNNGDILNSRNSSSLLDTPQVREAVQYYVDFFKEGYAPLGVTAGTDIFNAFKTGYLPMFISGPWMLEEIHKQIPEIDDKWGVSVLPKKARSTSFVGGSNLAIFKQSKNRDIAWRFIEFVSQPRIQVEWYHETKDLPSVKLAWEDASLRGNTKLNIFGEQLKDAKAPPAIPEWEQIGDVINNYMEQVVFQKISIDSFIQNSNEDINVILTTKLEKQSNLYKIFVFSIIFILIMILFIAYFKVKPKGIDSTVSAASFKGIWNILKTYHIPYLFIMPSMILFVIFLFAPIFLSFIMSLTNYDIFALNNFNNLALVGFKNYKILLCDPLFWKALGNTFYFILVGGPLSVSMSLLAAIALNSKLVKFKTTFRTGYFTPVVTTMVAVAVIWRWLYDPRFGLINWLLECIGVGGKNWLGDVNFAMPALILMAAWKNFGYNMVIFLAGLQTIPVQVYEAAEIDGATKNNSFWYITLPLLRPTLFFVTIITTIGYFQFFAEPYIMTDGGPLNSTLSIVLFMYREGFKYFKLGYASAIAYVLFGIIGLFSLLQYKLSKASFEY